ncbi:TonB-dependent receptor domain-containing protein [Membranihabitans maritimus]|uniref:TonB-dependent receptor domain-containing protein n=1 Tax=Membranihabitans maritimus TaxID=2904244 RepID=UPI001F1DDA9C|nr:TonB-dependent receptor [Membranihabitans maritimus]
MRKYIIAILSVFVVNQFLWAQFPGGGSPGSSIVGKITGKVIDSVTQSPIEFATIALRKSGFEKDIDGTISNADGSFEIRNLKPGKYDVNISFIGYTSKIISDIELTLKEPDSELGTIILMSDQVLLETVKVEGQKALVENKVDRLVYNAEEDASVRGGDAADVLRKVPMLNVDMNGNVSLRGSQNLRILVNGKPSGIFSGSIADALKMIPADEISKVEVITTPSAKYDGEGSGGIINIITKKSKVQGVSGNVNASVGNRQNRAAFNISGVKQRFGINGGGGLFYSWPQEGTNSFIREDQIGDQTRIFDQSGTNNTSRIGFRGKFGAYYDFNAFNSINSNISFRGFSFNNESELNSLFMDPVQNLTEQYQRFNDGYNLRSGFDWTTDYTHKFSTEGHELVFAYQLNADISRDNKTIERIGNDPLLDYTEKNKNIGDNFESTFQVDYTNPITENVKLETGLKGVIRNIDSDYDFKVLSDEGQFQIDPSRTNDFIYGQDVFAGYASMNFTIAETWSMVAGARYEHTTIDGVFGDGTGAFDQEYGNVLPSIILSKKVGMNTFKGSFTQRIQRPSLHYINPYRNQEERKIITEGNPELEPELSNQYELGYSTFLGGTVINFSTYYRRTKDIISSYLNINDEGVSVNTFENVGKTDVYGANLFTSFTIKNNLTLRGNIDVNQYKVIEAAEEFNVEDATSNLIYRLFVSSSYNFGKGWKAELFAFYNSHRWSIQGKLPSFSMMNFGIQKEIFGERGTVGLTVIDPFNATKSFTSELEGANFSQQSDFSIPFRSFGVNFSYRFGKLDFKQQNRQSVIKNDDLKGGDGGGQQGGGGQGQF